MCAKVDDTECMHGQETLKLKTETTLGKFTWRFRRHGIFLAAMQPWNLGHSGIVQGTPGNAVPLSPIYSSAQGVSLAQMS